jgi:1-acyl-sn-glycerol-3-phosphate acyltransferase
MSLLQKTSNILRAISAVLIVVVSTCFFFVPFLLLGLVKCVPAKKLQHACASRLDTLIIAWSLVNALYIKKAYSIEWNIKNDADLHQDRWHLIIANHQTWLDVVVLMQIFTKKIPTMRFFIKDALKWLPFLNVAWWILGYPFLKRYTKAYLEKHPEKKEKNKQSIQI